jgi:hypothetical protein
LTVTEKEPGAWGYNWATLSLGDKIKRPCPPGWGLDATLMTLPCKKNIIMKSREMKTGCNLAESYKEGHGSKGAVSTMTISSSDYIVSEGRMINERVV